MCAYQYGMLYVVRSAWMMADIRPPFLDMQDLTARHATPQRPGAGQKTQGEAGFDFLDCHPHPRHSHQQNVTE
jgi:hypothetical protein